MSDLVRILVASTIGYLVGWMDNSWIGLGLFMFGIVSGLLIRKYLESRQ